MTIVSSTKLRDTLYFRLMVYGQKSTKDRYFSLKQSTLSHVDSVSYVNDSTAVAVEGINFVAFDDPEMQKYCVIHPDSSSVYIPIIMTYDPNTAGERQNFCLYFEIVPNEEISVFDPRFYRAELLDETNCILMKDYDGQEVMFTSCFLNDYISVIL